MNSRGLVRHEPTPGHPATRLLPRRGRPMRVSATSCASANPSGVPVSSGAARGFRSFLAAPPAIHGPPLRGGEAGHSGNDFWQSLYPTGPAPLGHGTAGRPTRGRTTPAGPAARYAPAAARARGGGRRRFRRSLSWCSWAGVKHRPSGRPNGKTPGRDYRYFHFWAWLNQSPPEVLPNEPPAARHYGASAPCRWPI